MKDQLITYLDKKWQPLEDKNSKSYGIFYKGVRIKLSNGKSFWKKVGHAKSAIKNDTYYCLRRCIVPNFYGRSPEVQKAIEEEVAKAWEQLWADKTIEVREL